MPGVAGVQQRSEGARTNRLVTENKPSCDRKQTHHSGPGYLVPLIISGICQVVSRFCWREGDSVSALGTFR